MILSKRFILAIQVGCGAASYKDGKWFTTLYTCNYGPGGNFIRGEMYKAGRACSECPSGTSCSKDFPGLCAAPSNSTISVLPKGAPAPVNTINTSRPKAVNRQKTTSAPRRTTTRRATTTRRPTTTTTFAPTTRRVTARPTTTTVKTTVEAKQTGRPRQPGQPLFSCAFEPKEKSCRSRYGKASLVPNPPHCQDSILWLMCLSGMSGSRGRAIKCSATTTTNFSSSPARSRSSSSSS